MLGGFTSVSSLLTRSNGDLIAGGFFTSAGGASARYIARWDGTAWAALGAGTDSDVEALAVLASGDLIAAGQFSTAGSLVANHIARYSFTSGSAPTISSHPVSMSTCASGSAAFAVTTQGTSPLTYSWRKDSVPIDTSSNPSASTASLTLSNASGSAAGSYDCVVSNACGSITSDPATLTVCVADTDDGSASGVCDAGVTIDDLLFYLSTFEQGLPRADVDDGTFTGTPDLGVTIDDLLYFLSRFQAGC